jgi:hypothetical protein
MVDGMMVGSIDLEKSFDQVRESVNGQISRFIKVF